MYSLEVTKVTSNFSSQTVRELRAFARERCLRRYSKLCKAELVVLLENDAMENAAFYGHVDIVKLSRKRGATAFNRAMVHAAYGGHVEIVKLCREYGAKAFDDAMDCAAYNGHVDIIELCRGWGATGFSEAMRSAAYGGFVDLVEQCERWGGVMNCYKVMVVAARRGHVDIVKIL